MNNIRTEHGIVKTDAPDHQLVNLIESMGRCVRQTEFDFSFKRWNRLVEIYYYLRYGLLGHAWIKINDLRDDLRWRIPADVYHSLKDICKDMNIKIA